MGNTPSAQQSSPARGQTNGDRAQTSSQSASNTGSTSSRLPNLRLPMPQRPTHRSPQSSNPTSPSGARSGSPRRRKSLELPDLNKLSFTPAAPVPTTATHTSHHLAPTTPAAGHAKAASVSAVPQATSATVSTPTGKWRQALGGRTSPLVGPNALGAMSKLESSVPAPKTAPISMRHASVSPTRLRDADINPYFPVNPPSISPTKPREASPRGAEPIPIHAKIEAPPIEPPRKELSSILAPAIESIPPTVTATPPSQISHDEAEESNDGLVSVPVQWTGGGKVVYVTGNFADNWKGRIKLKRR